MNRVLVTSVTSFECAGITKEKRKILISADYPSIGKNLKKFANELTHAQGDLLKEKVS